MLAHFGAIAEATPLPVVVYNIPGRTAANMLPETLLELARPPRQHRGRQRIERRPQADRHGLARPAKRRFMVWAGDDHLFLPCLALGADGVVGVASHLCSREYRRMLDAYRAGRVDEAAEIHGIAPAADRRALCDDESDSGEVGDAPAWVFAPANAACRSTRMPAALADRLRAAHRAVRIPYPLERSVEERCLEILGCRLDPIDARRGGGSHPRARERGRRRAGRHARHRDGRATRNAIRAFARSSTHAALSLCDTVGVLAVARRRGAALRERVTGVELIERLCAGAAARRSRPSISWAARKALRPTRPRA